MEYANQKQSNSAYHMRTVLRRLNCDKISQEIFCGEVYITANHAIYGHVAGVVKPRGGKEWLTFPKDLKFAGWRKIWR